MHRSLRAGELACNALNLTVNFSMWSNGKGVTKLADNGATESIPDWQRLTRGSRR